MIRVIKRDGRIVKYNQDKIAEAVMKAMKSVGEVNKDIANRVATDVTQCFKDRKEVSVEEIQDKVEDALIVLGNTKLAKEYILYREERAKARELRESVGIEYDSLKFGVNALTLLSSRYLKTKDGKKETPNQLFKRVARATAKVEKLYGNNPDYWYRAFYNLMSNKYFMPSTPILANAGNSNGLCWFACFAFDIEDTMESILQTAKECGIVQQMGGGVGLYLSNIRPEGDAVKSTEGIASGPVSFMRVFDTISDVTKQGGCVGAGSLIRTQNGIIPIGNLLNSVVNRENATSHSVMTRSGMSPAYLAKNNGFSEVISITSELGNTITVTGNHLVAFVNDDGYIDFKPANTVSVGDWVVSVVGGHLGTEQKVIPVERDKNELDVSYPEYLNENLSEFIGLYMADGCHDHSRMIISCNTNDEQEIGRAHV